MCTSAAATGYDLEMRCPKISAETKLALLRRHFLYHEPAFKLAQEAGVDASTFHRWQKRFLTYSLQYGKDAFRPRSMHHRSDSLWELDSLLEKLSETL